MSLMWQKLPTYCEVDDAGNTKANTSKYSSKHKATRYT